MSTYQDEQLRFGNVIEVDGHEVVVEAERLTVDDPDECIACSVEPGGFVLIGADNTASVAVVSGIRVGAPKRTRIGGAADHGAAAMDDRKLVYCSLVGFLPDAKTFARGILRFPTYGAPVFVLRESALCTMFEQTGDGWLAVGERHQRGSGQEHVRIDRLFGRHAAVLGTTGSGKSWTVASLLQGVMKQLPHSRILFFDLHDEYRRAFPEMGEGYRVRHVRPADLRLPYWCLNADEIEALFASSEHRGANQSALIKDTIRRLREGQAQELGISPDRISVDTPVYFSFSDFIDEIRQKDAEMIPGAAANSKKQGPHFGTLGNLILRLESRLKDPKFSFLFPEDVPGRDGLLDLFDDMLGTRDGTQMTILDLSGLASDVRSVIIGVICRLAYEFKYWDEDPHDLPLLLVLEEAHNYLPRVVTARYQTSTESAERIAKEGRKYGLSLFVVSQRPSELNETVLSQCSSFIALRLTNPADQDYVRRLLPDFLAVAVDSLPYLRTGEAVIAGEAVILPTRVEIQKPEPAPRSDDVSYLKAWQAPLREDYRVSQVLARWRKRER